MREQDTVTGDLLQIFLIVDMNLPEMLQQDTPSFEFLGALRALAEHVCCVYSDVTVESTRLIESLSTKLTHVRLDVGVSPLVSVQIADVSETFITFTARILLTTRMTVQMELEVGLLVKTFITERALELDFLLVIPLHMISQLASPVKLQPANITTK